MGLIVGGRLHEGLTGETLERSHRRPAPETRVVAELVPVRRPFAQIAIGHPRARQIESRTARPEVAPRRRVGRVFEVAVKVANAVVVPDKTRLRVVVEGVVRRRAETAHRLPLPCEAHLASGGGVGVGGAGISRTTAPCGTAPRLDRVAVVGVGDALRRDERGRGEGVGADHLVRGLLLVALQVGAGRGHEDVRHGRAPEVAEVVHHAVPRHLLVRERMVVVAEELEFAPHLGDGRIRHGTNAVCRVGKRIERLELVEPGRHRAGCRRVRAAEQRRRQVRAIEDGRHVVMVCRGIAGVQVIISPLDAPDDLARGFSETEGEPVCRDRQQVAGIKFQ